MKNVSVVPLVGMWKLELSAQTPESFKLIQSWIQIYFYLINYCFRVCLPSIGSLRRKISARFTSGD